MARFWVTAIDSMVGVEREIEVEAPDRDSAARAAQLQLPKGTWVVGNVREAPRQAAPPPPPPPPSYAPVAYPAAATDQRDVLDRLEIIAAELAAIRASRIIQRPRWTIAEGGLLWLLIVVAINIGLWVLMWAMLTVLGLSLLNAAARARPGMLIQLLGG